MPYLTESQKKEILAVIRQAPYRELLDRLQDVAVVEQQCRQAFGIGPDDRVPFFVNPLTGFLGESISAELDRRDCVEHVPIAEHHA